MITCHACLSGRHRPIRCAKKDCACTVCFPEKHKRRRYTKKEQVEGRLSYKKTPDVGTLI